MRNNHFAENPFRREDKIDTQLFARRLFAYTTTKFPSHRRRRPVSQ